MERIQQGDLVQVVTGKEKGKRGQVVKIIRDCQRVVVKGLMLSKRHLKPSQSDPKGSVIQKESSIHVSNVMPIDPKTDKPTRVGYQDGKNGKVRVSKSKVPLAAKLDSGS